ncbi:hypothetical protein CC80DRAFT_291660 [Byssothecium circinans]|uniref:Uncharacterized protein n=1 Tax=Byssothecium circinans TaxID=147558 RepID=A0A6A5U6L5_9PLEO|nr:hypothetical protein CC80DRAFT_291660 [Byssothecium circinans]
MQPAQQPERPVAMRRFSFYRGPAEWQSGPSASSQRQTPSVHAAKLYLATIVISCRYPSLAVAASPRLTSALACSPPSRQPISGCHVMLSSDCSPRLRCGFERLQGDVSSPSRSVAANTSQVAQLPLHSSPGTSAPLPETFQGYECHMCSQPYHPHVMAARTDLKAICSAVCRAHMCA